MAEIRRIIANTTINGAEVIRFLTPTGTWQVNWSDKFLTITAFNYSLNLFLTFLILVLNGSFLARNRIRSTVTLVVIVLGTMLFHVVTGIVLLCCVIVSLVFLYLGSRYIYRERQPLSRYYVLLFTIILVSAVALPYFFSLVTRSGDAQGSGGGGIFHDRFHVGGRSILTILLPLSVLLFPAREAFKRLFSGVDHVSRTMIAWIICLLFFCIFINIGIVGEKKFIYFLFLVIGPPIYLSLIHI